MDKQTADFINSKGYQDALAEGLRAVDAAVKAAIAPRHPFDIDLPSSEYHRLNFGNLE